jgi:rhodanese-related sulfurtransferase
MSLLKKLFGGSSVDFATLVKQGAMIIDVRSPADFKGGHVSQYTIAVFASKYEQDSKEQNHHYLLCVRYAQRKCQKLAQGSRL